MYKILFYSSEWDCFSRFSAFQVFWRLSSHPTVEHAYQAAKFYHGLNDKRYADIYSSIIATILSANSPQVARELSHQHEDKLDPYWDSKKLLVMEEIVRAKLEQHEYIQRKLVKTCDVELIEDSPTNAFWGRGTDWHGENHLGKIWMKLRDEEITRARRIQRNM